MVYELTGAAVLLSGALLIPLAEPVLADVQGVRALIAANDEVGIPTPEGWSHTLCTL